MFWLTDHVTDFFCWNCDQFLDSLLYSRAYWVTEGVIAWNVDAGEGSCYLYASRVAGLSFSEDGIDGALTFYLSSFVTTVSVKAFISFNKVHIRFQVLILESSLKLNPDHFVPMSVVHSLLCILK